MKLDNIRCPSCNSLAIDDLGTIPSSIYFAGQKVSNPIPGGALRRCQFCNLRFRYPRLTKDELDSLYRQAPASNWQYAPSSRKDWHIARQWIDKSFTNGKLLDIGCFDGGFLLFVGGGLERFGIEMNSEAANLARMRNIEIVGVDFADIGKLSCAFDVVVAMDVVEHMENPFAFLESVSAVLSSGGLFCLSTGNTESWSWRLMGSCYWYCTVSEHISFINPSWCQYAAPSVGLEIVGYEKFSHCGDATRAQRITDLGKNLVYRFSPRAVAWLRKKGFGGVDATVHESLAATPPMWLSATDHFIVLFRKR